VAAATRPVTIPAVRLIVTLVWLFAALLWLPWGMLVLRLALDLLLGLIPGVAHLGHSWSASPYVQPVFDALSVRCGWPQWEHSRLAAGWFTARIGSVYPWAALASCALTGAGWRLYWIAEEGLLRHGPRAMVLSTLLPPLASLLMYRDAQLRYRAAEADLAGARQDALRRMQG
jgi:hypothetical protein